MDAGEDRRGAKTLPPQSVLERNAGRDIRFIGHSAGQNAAVSGLENPSGLACMRNFPAARDIGIKDTIMRLVLTLNQHCAKES
jgi:hypothetical protein